MECFLRSSFNCLGNKWQFPFVLFYMLFSCPRTEQFYICFRRLLIDIRISADNASAQVNKNCDHIGENSLSDGIHETSPDRGHTLPILKKILDLSTKIQVNLIVFQSNQRIVSLLLLWNFWFNLVNYAVLILVLRNSLFRYLISRYFHTCKEPTCSSIWF